MKYIKKFNESIEEVDDVEGLIEDCFMDIFDEYSLDFKIYSKTIVRKEGQKAKPIDYLIVEIITKDKRDKQNSGNWEGWLQDTPISKDEYELKKIRNKIISSINRFNTLSKTYIISQVGIIDKNTDHIKLNIFKSSII